MSNLIAKINVKTIDIYDNDIFFTEDELKDYMSAPVSAKREYLSELFYEGALDSEITIDLYE